MLGFDMSNTTLGIELRKARRGMGMTLKDMADRTGVELSVLSRIESEKIPMPKRETLSAISGGYGLPLEYLAQLVYCGKPAEDQPAHAERLVGASV
jgi:transcriptional regulator with XRE-family HTH domain